MVEKIIFVRKKMCALEKKKIFFTVSGEALDLRTRYLVSNTSLIMWGTLP